MIALEDRQIVAQNIQSAHADGARLRLACEIAGIDLRTLQRWQAHEGCWLRFKIEPPLSGSLGPCSKQIVQLRIAIDQKQLLDGGGLIDLQSGEMLTTCR